MISSAIPAFAEAESDSLASQDKPRHEFQATIGYGRISINEIVYYDGQRLSHLRWEAQTPIVTLNARYELADNWTLGGKLAFSANGNAHMIDYDWLAPHAQGTGYDQWTDRSLHPDTRLQHYFDFELALGRDYALNKTTDINLHGGLKYTSAELDAYGGSYIDSEDSFRDSQGKIPDNLAVISYKQWHRAIFVGTEIRQERNEWQFSGLFRAGLSIKPKDVDNHWLRNLRYHEQLDSTPFAQIRLGAKREFKNGVSFYAGASYQKYFEAGGDTVILDTTTQTSETFINAIAADMSVMTFDIGISRDF